mgnify:CR=1 FL=1
MIKVKVFCQPDGRISGFDVSGHSGTANAGEDIVCAGVSFLGITEYLHREVSYDAASGKLRMELKGEPDERTESILQTMLLGLSAIAEAYPKAVRILK